MQHIRLNQAVKRHYKDQNLYLFLGTKKITFPFLSGLYQLLYDGQAAHRFFSKEELLSDYWISEKLFSLLWNLNVFIISENCLASEAITFHALAENPSTTYLPEQRDEAFVTHLYQNLENFFHSSLGSVIDKNNIYSPEKLSSILSFQLTRSTRKAKAALAVSKKDEILAGIATLCSTREEFHFYGSGWGLYSLYPVLVFNDDTVFIFDRFKDVFYVQQASWIYQEICDTYIPTPQNCFNHYECHLLLLSAHEATLSKYGNRGYKYIQLEAGALSTLIRQYTANLSIPQLEVQGYFDQLVWHVLEKHLGIVKEKTLLVHMMCLN